MHEIGLVNEAAADFLTSVGSSPVSKVVMAIGPKVEPEVARQAWDIAVADTQVASAILEFVDALDEMKCFDCEEEYQGTLLEPCPKCDGNGLVVKPADEVTIASWEA